MNSKLENGTFKLSTDKMRDEIYAAVLGMMNAYKKHPELSRLDDKAMDEMCKKYAHHYVEALIRQNTPARPDLQ